LASRPGRRCDVTVTAGGRYMPLESSVPVLRARAAACVGVSSSTTHPVGIASPLSRPSPLSLARLASFRYGTTLRGRRSIRTKGPIRQPRRRDRTTSLLITLRAIRRCAAPARSSPYLPAVSEPPLPLADPFPASSTASTPVLATAHGRSQWLATSVLVRYIADARGGPRAMVPGTC